MKKIILLLFIFIIFQFQCKTKESDYEKKYNTRVLLSYLILPPPLPLDACIHSYQTAENCLKNSTEFPLSPYPVNETTLVTILNQSSVNPTYSSLCTKILSSANFKNYTERGKECIMNCNQSYWQLRIDTNLCTEKFTVQINSSLTGPNSCYANCFKTSNNDRSIKQLE
ncbi:MAG: hypothetical protein L6Q54_06080 [Leptospiraceae bacterium]|nr:hypothetical protein [Leptospiraceae bacterium]MCK6380804.1 hypothetical protein [Leptospiraceae bacterium]